MNAPLSRQALRAPEHRAVTPPVQVQTPAMAMRSATSAAPPSLAGLKVSSPHDAAEHEATQVARRIVSLPPAPVSNSSARFAGLVPTSAQRAPAPASAPAARSTSTPVPGLPGSGQPLPRPVRDFMEPRFGADFSAVRIHTGPQAAQASRQLNAAAFTVGNQIVFGRDAYQPDSGAGRELIAHELTHTIQQGAAPQVRRSLAPAVNERSTPAVQRLGIGDALNYFAEHANNLPGFRMFTLVLGVNPINLRAVDRSPGNLLRAVVELMPGGALITRALDNHGIIDRVAGWVQQQIATLGMVGSSIRQAVDRFLDGLGWRDIFDLGGVWERAKRIVTEPIGRITSFVGGLVSGVLQFIRDAILRPLAGLAANTRGWDLLCAVLGRNPITGEAVPRTAATLIGGFMRLIGQEEVWQNIQRGNAIGRAFAWFQGALAGLMGFVTALPGLFMDTLRSLGVADLVTLPQTFARIARVFGDFAGRFFSWAGQQVMSLLEIIFEVVAPSVMPYLRRAAGALRTIIADPIRFIGNLVRAGVQGLRQFATNILTHLRASLIGWLTGAMGGAGLYIPQAFTLPEIVKFVLSVLGLTWQNIRGKLVRVVGETAVNALETGFDIVVTLVREGPAAAWQKIQETLGNLRDMVMEQVMSFVRTSIVTAAITRLVSSLNPAGAFIQAIIAIYNTVMFFIERMRQIAQVAASVIDSIAAIASGAIGAAANRVEQSMAGLLTLVISFLARLVGLGRVSDAVTNIINRIRAPIDRALDRVVDWIVAAARRLGRFVAQAGVPNDPRERLRLGMDAAVAVVARRPGGGPLNAGLINGLMTAIRVRYGFRILEAVFESGRWWVRGEINPGERRPLTEDDIALLRQIREVADRELDAASSGQPVVASGTHDTPRVIPPGGVVVVAASLPTTLPRGGQEVLATTEAGGRGVVRRPPFGDAIVTGASPDERRVRIGRYRDVAATLSSIGNDRFVASAARDLLQHGEIPSGARHLTSWFGGFRTLMGLEVRRDPMALATLGSVLTMAGAGALSISAAFAQAGDASAAERPEGQALFTHAAPGALATLRQMRDEVGAPQRPNAPASRSSRAVAQRAMQAEVEAVTRAAQIILRTNVRPSNADIVAAVRQAMRGIIGGRAA